MAGRETTQVGACPEQDLGSQKDHPQKEEGGEADASSPPGNRDIDPTRNTARALQPREIARQAAEEVSGDRAKTVLGKEHPPREKEPMSHAPPPNDKTPPPPLGVHSSVFVALHQKHTTLTTEQLCEKVIKPATASQQCAYVDLLKYADLLCKLALSAAESSLGSLVAPATCFISHAWINPFSDIHDAVQQYEEQHPNTYYWLDLFVNNQHKATSNPFEWWCTTFKESIRSIGSVMLVMSPWNNPVPLTRAWCLFEMYSGIVVEAKMSVVIPSQQVPPFKEAMGAREGFDTILNTLMALDAEKAGASRDRDKEEIFKVVRGQIAGGFVTLNNKVKGHLRECYLRRCAAIAEETENGDLLYNLSRALNGFGDHDKAHDLAVRCLAICWDTRGEGHFDSAFLCNHLGIILSTKGNHDKALEYYQKSLAIYVAVLGENHSSTATTYHNMGQIYHRKGDFDKALEYYQKSLPVTLAVLGENHPSIATTYGNMGQAYSDKGDFDKALEYYQESLAIKLAALGENHPEIATTYNNMGQAYSDKGDYDKALEYYQKDLTITLAVLGENHPHTATTYNSMGQAYSDKGDYDKALEYYQKDLTITLAVMGENHPSTATAYNNMGVAYSRKGDYDKALEYYQKDLTITLAVLGENHPETGTTYSNMGHAYCSMGDFEQAKTYLEKAVSIFHATVGDNHPDSRVARASLRKLT